MVEAGNAPGHLTPARTASTRVLAAVAVALTAAIRVTLWVLPFRVIRRLVASVRQSGLINGVYTREQIAWAVRVASRFVPGATCLTQALAAHVLLAVNGLDSRLRIGVARTPGFEAHAWVECDGRVLVGGTNDSTRFAPMLTLDADPLERRRRRPEAHLGRWPSRVMGRVMQKLSLTSRIIPNDDVLFQELQGEAVLLDLKTGIYFGLDEVGTRIWQLLPAHERVPEIVDALLPDYDVAEEPLSADVMALVAELAEQGLVTIE